MSVRFFKILSLVLLIHLTVFYLIWVGFSAPSPRPPARFVYLGAQPVGDQQDSAREVFPDRETSSGLVMDHGGDPVFNRWMQLRELSKP